MDLEEEPKEPEQPETTDENAEERMKILSRRGFIWAAVAVAGTYEFFHVLHEQHPFGYKTPAEDGVTWPFRDALNFDDRVTSALYSPSRLSPTYGDSAITEARVNGDVGLSDDSSDDSGDTTADSSPTAPVKDDKKAKPGSVSTKDAKKATITPTDQSDDSSDSASGSTDTSAKADASDSSSSNDDSADTSNTGFDPKKWSLILQGQADPKIKALKIEDIKALPRHEFVTEFKCIEGWSYFMKWAGARLSDFIAKYPPSMRADYVALETPDGQYYVSIDMPAAMHPQTLLAYEMNGKPLELEHGAPLRLIIPHKYGVKNLKRIGKLAYTSRPPKDYWAEQGYDYYAGL